MPNLDGGDVEGARAKMEQNLAALLPYVRRGLKIVVTGPTCSYSMRKEWPQYVARSEAAEVGAATLDVMELFDGLRRKKQLDREFLRGFGKIAYHAACHLRAQKIAIPGARVLSQLPLTEVRIVERCSAVDGTWGMKAAYYDEGLRYATKLGRALDEGRAHGEGVVVSDCSLAGLRVLELTGRYPPHPAVLFAVAYGLLAPDEAGLGGDELAASAEQAEEAR
jgi:glycerol-3-phosphate dehydrogenase subunit C